MSQFRRVLVPVDFSPLSLEALRFGASLARHDQATLHLVHAVQDVVPLTAGGGDYSALAAQYFSEAEAAAKQALEGPATATLTDGLSVVRETLTGTPADRLLEFAEANQIDLICVGTHGRGGLSRLLLGSVAEKMVQRAKCAVLVVRQTDRTAEAAAGGELRLGRVVVPVDFSDSSQTAVAEAADLARRFGAELHLLHVVEDSSPAVSEIALARPVFRSYLQDLLKSGEGALAELVLPVELPAGHVKRRVVVGEPIDQITGYARDNEADMIVMGTHGRTGPAHWFLGSVAERVVRSAPCPVLVTRVKPAG